MANHKHNKFCFDGGVVEVSRGQFITSIAKLAETWGWGRKKTSNFLNNLEKDGMIKQKRTSQYTKISIVNYAKYQSDGSEGNTKRTSKGHHMHTNNNEKKIYRDPMLDPRREV
jgi:DNA replication protein DnaD